MCHCGGAPAWIEWGNGAWEVLGEVRKLDGVPIWAANGWSGSSTERPSCSGAMEDGGNG